MLGALANRPTSEETPGGGAMFFSLFVLLACCRKRLFSATQSPNTKDIYIPERLIGGYGLKGSIDRWTWCASSCWSGDMVHGGIRTWQKRARFLHGSKQGSAEFGGIGAVSLIESFSKNVSVH